MLASNWNASDDIEGMKRNSSFAQNPKKVYSWLWMKKRIYLYVYIKIWGKNEFLIIVWKSSDAFELDVKVVNFV